MTPPSPSHDDDESMRSTYVRVIAIEVVVLAALWTFQYYFTR